MYYDEFKNIPEWHGRIPFETSVAFLLLQGYVNNTIIQWHRIQEDKKAFTAQSPEKQGILMRTLFLDVHSYFVSYNMSWKLFGCLAQFAEKEELTSFLNKFKPKFEPFVKARDLMEHPYPRIKEWKHLRDWCNIRGDTMTIAGKAYDIGESGLKILKDAFEELVDIFRLKP